MTYHLIPSIYGSFLLSLLATLAVPGAARADEYQDHLARSGELAGASQQREALKELQDAYAIQQVPELLPVMARLHLQLGDGKAALDAYRRFRLAVPSSDAATRKEADEAIAHLAALYEPNATAMIEARYKSYTANIERARRRQATTSLMVGGGVMFGMGYAATVIAGTWILADNGCGLNSQTAQCKLSNGLLMVPFVGPIISGFVMGFGDPGQTIWSLSWILLDVPVQIGGLAMMIAGSRSNQALAKIGQLTSVRLLPYATPGASGLAVAGRF